jgi:predicted nuclease of predicted toxin-antitoxin system
LGENLSRKLVIRLAELYPESAHVAEAGLLECPDREIWEFAKARDFVIVSTNSDFRRCSRCPTSVMLLADGV